jgi:hypothetical protein
MLELGLTLLKVKCSIHIRIMKILSKKAFISNSELLKTFKVECYFLLKRQKTESLQLFNACQERTALLFNSAVSIISKVEVEMLVLRQSIKKI